MKVYYKCLNCKEENLLKTSAGTRVEFAMENGKNKKYSCGNCNRNNVLLVNNFYAKESKMVSIISGIIFLVGTLIGLYFVMQMVYQMVTVMGIFIVASGLLIPVSIYGILKKEDSNRVRTFNQTYVSE